MTVEEDAIRVGTRVESDGHHATVRYIGRVPPTSGEWLGVEWDDQSRGRHDGSHEGKRYFETKHEKSGSFIRRKKVNLGVSFLTALQDRYGSIDGEDAGVIQEEMFVVGLNQQTTHVEIVGAKSVNAKQSAFNTLRELAFRNMAINGEPTSTDIGALLPNVKLLDVLNNLLPDWESIAKITRTLSKLEVLNVGTNRLALPKDPESLKSAFIPVRTLLLNRMDYDWEQVLQSCAMFSNLQELHVCINRISAINHLHDSLMSLRVLNLENNPLTEWDCVLKLGVLQNLEMLILNECGISKVEFPDVKFGQVTKHFPSLKILHLKQTNISQWSSIDEMNKLASFENLIMRGNPLNEPTKQFSEASIRSITIGKIAKLKILNRSQITEEERKGAEVDYMKIFGKAWRESGGHQDPKQNHPSAKFCEEHPRYQPIIDKYGAPEDSELKEISSAIRESLISLMIKCPDDDSKRVITKKLPVSLTVQKLKNLISKVYKMDIATITLTYTSPQTGDQEFDLEMDTKEMDFYAIEEGDTVLVRQSDM